GVGVDLLRLRVPVRLVYVLMPAALLFGGVWFRASAALSQGVLQAGWHPVVSIMVYHAWLCCSLVLGLYVVDRAVYLAATRRPRALLRYLSLLAGLALGVGLLGGGEAACEWVGAAGVAALLLGCVLCGRGGGGPVVTASAAGGASRRLSGHSHFRWLTASCITGAALACVLTYGGIVPFHEEPRRRLHTVLGGLHLAFVSLVYASSVAGPWLLWSGDPDESWVPRHRGDRDRDWDRDREAGLRAMVSPRCGGGDL
ncbi:unnamed protein product, partial [Discosporangium mesarthrocarpum]